MSFEYERRFLVPDVASLSLGPASIIVQGYLWTQDRYCVRVRRRYVPVDDGYYETSPMLALKGPREDARRREYEMPIDVVTARELLKRTPEKIVKERHQLVDADALWDIDVFRWDNAGLVIAECEGRTPMKTVVPPEWCGPEITEDPRYDNEQLAAKPFRTWP